MKRLSLPGVVVVLALFFSGTAFAQYTSSNYKANEVYFGTGGDNGQASSNYKAQASVGTLGVGNYKSTNYQTFSGFLTPNEPFLELQIDTAGTVNLGTLSTTATATGTADFHVRAYVNSGYTVQTMNQPPSYISGAGSHTLTAMSLGSAATGTEQFGINLVHNTSPANFGNDPSPQPDNTYATGIAAPNYNTTNQFKYGVGDVVACTGSSGTCGGTVSGWGLTLFTISYIANINSVTPAGTYTAVQDLVAIATY